MDAVSSVAAVMQLAAQVLELWQQIDRARERVKSAPKVFEDTKTQQCDLINIIQTIKDSPGLHIPAVHARVERINTISLELYKVLEAMVQRQRNSPIRQGLHALVRAEKDDAKLNDVLKRLDRAKDDLMIQIGVVNTGIVGELRNNSMNRVVDKTNTFFIEGNESMEHANQINGVIGIDTSETSTTAGVMENKALGNSQQKNLILSGSDIWKLLEI
ncbi:hypothetical protein F4806DRAFT_484272 [Annulohypoxylon nitens]|nr:hypothetical protein F4806DRAFT_484272 [Annulohypoxylon nitens]